MRKQITREQVGWICILVLGLFLLVQITGCTTITSHIPEVCQQAVPTTKNCFSLQGGQGQGVNFGPVNIYSQKF